jgi:hypothetical protein
MTRVHVDNERRRQTRAERMTAVFRRRSRERREKRAAPASVSVE